MQRLVPKFFKFFLPVCLFLPKLSYAQPDTGSLAQADSLFQAHQYTEALGHYEHILEQDQQYSASMLLKMAYIKEGLHDLTGAMYYLHLYYAKYPSRSVLRKMEELAQPHQLTGYTYNDWLFFLTQFQKRYMLLLELMLIVAVMVLTVILIRRGKGRRPGRALLTVLSAYLVFLLFYVNFLRFGREGIVRQDQVAVMSAPAAGATWLTTISQGHKVPILGEQDVWYQIRWNGEKAYIRKNNLLPLP